MNYYNEIKSELLNNEINRKVKNYSINKSDLITYYNVGKMLSEAGKHYGEGIINEYASKLSIDIGKGVWTIKFKKNETILLYDRKRCGNATPIKLVTCSYDTSIR